jgi:DNA-binding transcriptional LysR family regulator
LEEEFETKLLKRNTKAVELTDIGKIFLEKAKIVLGDYYDMSQAVRIATQGYYKSLKIGVPYYAMNKYLGDMTEKYENMHPNVKLMYSTGDPNEVLAALMGYRVDMALLPCSTFPGIDKYELHPLFDENLGVLISRKDELATQKKCCLSDLRDRLFFSVDNIYFYELWHMVKSLCNKSGFEPRGPSLLNQVEAAIIGAKRGDGVMILGEHMRKHESDEIAWLELEDAGCKRTVNVICSKQHKTPQVSEFVKMFSS